MRYIFSFLLLFFSIAVFAQLNFSFSQNKNELAEWSQSFNITHGHENEIFDRSTEISLGYIFRMPSERIEIAPSLSYAFTKQETFPNEATFTEIAYGTLEFHQFNFNCDFKIYPLDFTNNNRPTIIQQDNSILKQGLYIFASPSLSIFRPNYYLERIGVDDINREFLFFEFRYGGGLGFDVGISKNITISPFIAWYQINELPNDFLRQYDFDGGITFLRDESTTFKQRQIGINVVFEFLKLNK